MSNLGDRMKKYENVSRYYLTHRSPVIIRVDGRAFHTAMRRAQKPFDNRFMDCMTSAAQKTAEDISGFKLGYVQSDEVSFLLTDYDELETQGWFDYNLQKLVSIVAATMTAWFNRFFEPDKPGVFDARAFVIPRDEIANYFLWRARDWNRNSIQMFAQSLFSHSQLQNKSCADIHEMLHGIGRNWTTDLSLRQKNGTFFHKSRPFTFHYNIEPNYKDIYSLLLIVMEES